jgi:alpha-galactosidase
MSTGVIERSRREFLQTALAGLVVWPGRTQPGTTRPQTTRTGFLDIARPPDLVVTQTADGSRWLERTGSEWRADDVHVEFAETGGALRVRLSAPDTRIARLNLRWRGDTSAYQRVLGDAWERAYGDLEWRGGVPDRAMPWYCAAFDGEATHAYGVRTAPRAFCCWQIDSEGIELRADVRSGGSPIALGSRTLDVCDVVCRQGRAGESAFAALHAFCRDMCREPRRLAHPIYGSNDWYWAYGKNTRETVLADAHRIADLSSDANRPFAVIDDGWQPEHDDRASAGSWDRGNSKFGDMADVAAGIARAGSRPGIWIRPLQAPSGTPDAWRLPRDRAFLDPTVPDALHKVVEDVTRLQTWGFTLIKHDYTTFDLFGRWGSQMGTAMTKDGWTFAAGPSRTTAEVILDLYRAIRGVAGDAVVLGCNTVSHLSAGVFDACRIGDDTSGREWARTRKMGVNTLAFRGVQHDAFYAADADCVGITTAIPWTLNRQWLDLVSRSGTPLFVSMAPDAIAADQTRDLRAALARAARPQPLGEPIDWQHTVWPERWGLDGAEVRYKWIDPSE